MFPYGVSVCSEVMLKRFYRLFSDRAMSETRIYLDDKLREAVEQVRTRDKDYSMSQTARRLLRKALENEGIKVGV